MPARRAVAVGLGLWVLAAGLQPVEDVAVAEARAAFDAAWADGQVTVSVATALGTSGTTRPSDLERVACALHDLGEIDRALVNLAIAVNVPGRLAGCWSAPVVLVDLPDTPHRDPVVIGVSRESVPDLLPPGVSDASLADPASAGSQAIVLTAVCINGRAGHAMLTRLLIGVYGEHLRGRQVDVPDELVACFEEVAGQVGQ